MKTMQALKATAIMAICACALAAIAGCSSPSNQASDDTSGGSAPAENATTGAAPATDDSKADQGAADKQAAIDNAIELGFQVFDGTVHVCTAEELIELQGIDIDPAAAGGGGTYAVVVFDGPTQVIGQGSDGSGERTETANMIGVAEYTEYSSDYVVEYGDLDAWKALDGQQVTIAAQARDIWFPSDVSFPIGEPHSNETKIIE